jgi:hypothetical protein
MTWQHRSVNLINPFPVKYLFCLSLIAHIASSCAKKESISQQTFEIPDSTLYVKNVVQTNLNAFDIEYYIRNAKDGLASDFGLIVENDTNAADRRIIFFTSNVSGLLNKTISVDSLLGPAMYSVRLYAARGKDTIYSGTKQLKTEGLKILDFNQRMMLTRPQPITGIATNLYDKGNREIHSRAWVGDMEVRVVDENGSFVMLDVPENIPPGYTTLKIKRKGLEAVYDSIFVLFGTLKYLHDFPVEDNPGMEGPNHMNGYAVFQLGNKGYLFGGDIGFIPEENGSGYNVPDYYLEYQNPDVWRKVYYSTATRFRYPQVQVANNNAYVVAGFTDSTRLGASNIPLSNVYQFDAAGRKWIKKAAIPWGMRARSMSFVAGGKIYVGLGEGGDFSTGPATFNDLWEYDPNLDTWTRKADFPGLPRDNASAFVIGSKAYVVGGSTLNWTVSFIETTNEIWEYDIEANTWREVHPKQSFEPQFKPTCVVYNNKAYLLGGWRKIGYEIEQMPNYEFDPETESFTYIAPPISNTGGGCVFTQGNKFVLVGGAADGDLRNVSSNVTEFSPK